MRTNKNYFFLEIIILSIFICLGGQITLASDSPLIDNPFMNQTNLPQIPFLDKNSKIGQIFDQLQKTIENQIKTLFYQNTQQNVQKEAKKEVVKQTSFLEKDFFKNFNGIINNIKKLIGNIEQYFRNTFEEIKWKIMTPRY